MYGQYGQPGLFGGYDDGDSSQSESLSYPGAISKTTRKRVSLLGKGQRTSQPARILPLLSALNDMTEDENIAIAHAGDSSDMPCNLSSDSDDEATSGISSFPRDSSEMCMNSECQLCSTGMELNLKTINDSISLQEAEAPKQVQCFNYNQEWPKEPETVVPDPRTVVQICKDSISMQEAEAPKQVQCFSYNQEWPKEPETVVPDLRTVVQISNSCKTNGFVNNSDKDMLLSQKKNSTHREYLSAKSLSTDSDQERIINDCNSIKSWDTFLPQKVKTVEPFLEEVQHSHNSSELSVKKEGDKVCMRPPCSSARTNKGVVFRDIMNHKDILSLKTKSTDVKEATKIIQTSEENLKEMNIDYVTNKENDVGFFFASKTPALNITPARNRPLSDISVFDPNTLHLNKERDPQIPARKDVSMEKQLNKELESYTPLCNLNMKENGHRLDDEQFVKRDISTSNAIALNINKEKNFQAPVVKYITTEKQIHHKMVDGHLSLHKLNVKENMPSFDVVLPIKPENQTGKQSGSLDEPVPYSRSKTERESLTENSKQLSHKSSEGASSGEKMQSKSSFELIYKQSYKGHQNVASKPVRNCITVNGKGYKVQKILGRGGSSQVFEVLDPNTSQELAMKCVNLSVAEPLIAQGYLNEIDLLRRLQGSERVITMTDFEYAEEKQMLYVVMERGETDLSKLIKSISKTNQIPIITIIYYWVEMLRAVKNIHANGIIHSDLKPANFLLVGGCLKLIDFGIASSVQSDMTSVVKDAQAGTFNYMSPETIQGTNSTTENQFGYKISYKSDIWSLGCILYNLLYGKTPFQHIVQPWAKVAAITNPNLNIDYPKTRNDCPPVLLHAVQQCLTFDPKMRPTAADLLELPYVNYDPV